MVGFMKQRRIEIECDDRVFNHGEIKEVRKDINECGLEIEANLVVSIDDIESFHKELQELIKRYAI